MKNRMFHDWVSTKADLPLLLLINICVGFSSGISSSLASYMIGGLSTNPADAAMCSYAYLSGMSIAFPLVQALNKFLNSRSLLCSICVLLIFLNFVLTRTDSAPLMIFCTFLIGAGRLVGIIAVVSSLLPILMPKGERYQLYGLYYPVSLIVSIASGSYLVHLADKFNWQLSFHFCNLMLLIVLVIALLLMHADSSGRKLSLWKFDWFGMVLLAACMFSTDYVLVYGQTEDWLLSGSIKLNIALSLVFLTLFLYRNSRQKNPLLHFEMLQYRNVRIGLFIMFILGAFYSTSNSLTSLMNISFRNNQMENAQIGLYAVPGYILGSLLCYWYFRYHTRFREMILLSGICYLLSNMILYFSINPQLGENTLILPYVLRGMAIITSYITIGLYVAANVPGKKFPMVPVFLIFVRTYVGTVFWSCLYSNWLFRRQSYMMNRLVSWTDSTDPLFLNRFSPAGSFQTDIPVAYKTFSTQATLMSIKELYGWLIIAGIIMLILLLIFPVYVNNMDRRIFNWRKSGNVRDMAQTITT